jgi:SAM-dependent methyltransferase
VSNQEQAEFWNGDAGDRWVEFSDRLDAMLLPFAQAVLTTAKITASEDVLDIGCGAGALSLLSAQTAHSVQGVDISEPLITLAKQRSHNIETVQFALGDAAALQADKKRDIAISRFGVMFFSEPASAFGNIRAQLSGVGRMVFACWQAPALNLWARAPLEAAMPFLNAVLPMPEPGTPGPFAFADPDYVESVLSEAGWQDIKLSEWTGDICIPGKDVGEAADFMLEMGPLSRVIKEQNLEIEPVRTALCERLEKEADSKGRIKLCAAAWIVSANVN